MESLSLITELEKIPVNRENRKYSLKDITREMFIIEHDCHCIEMAAGVEIAFTDLFNHYNVPDQINTAYEMAWADVAKESSLYSHYSEMLERGPQSVASFINNLKGKLFELELDKILQEDFPGHIVEISSNPVQKIFDIALTSPSGENILIQAKMGASEYTSEVIERMEDSPNVLFALSDEIKEKILSMNPELADQIIDIDYSNYEFTEDVKEGLSLLQENLGIDVPDNIGEILPYIGEIVLCIRLIYDFIQTQKDFKSMDFSDKAKLSAIRAILIFARFGISITLAKLGAIGGSAMGSILPGPGNLIGSATGAIGGVASSVLLSKRIKPHYLKYAYNLAGFSTDEMFYFKNKNTIDNIGASLLETASTIPDRLYIESAS